MWRTTNDRVILVLCLTVLTLALSACQPSAPLAAPAQTNPQPTVAATPGEVATATPVAERRARGGMLAYTGDVRARSSVVVMPKVSGRIEELNVNVGDEVKAGDVVAVIEHAMLDAQVKQAEAGLAAAQANLAKLEAGPRKEQVAMASANLKAAQARLDLVRKTPFDDQVQTGQANVDRAKNALWQAQSVRDATCANVDGVWQEMPSATGMRGVLVAPGGNCTAAEAAVGQAEQGVRLAELQLDQVKAGPRQQDVAQAEAAVTAARESYALAQSPFTENDIAAVQAQVSAAEAASEMARLNRDEAFVKAPLDGVVASRPAVVGMMASSGLAGATPLMTLVSKDVQIIFTVEDVLYNEVKAGQPVKLTVAAYPDETFTGKIAFIAPVADPVARTFEATVYPDDPEHKLRPGMFADVELEAAP